MIKCSLLKLISHKYSAWCIRLCFYKVFNSSLFDKNNNKKNPTYCLPCEECEVKERS